MLFGALSLAVAGAAQAQPFPVNPPPAATVARLDFQPRQSVALAKMAGNLRAGSIWAEELAGDFICTRNRLVEWDGANNQIGEDAGFSRTFREELGALGFLVAGDPTDLFASDAKRADLQVGAVIQDMRLRSCRINQYVTDIFNGAITMDVDWQIFSVAKGAVVARIRTNGGYEIKKGPKTNNAGHLIGGAFGDNVRRLAADPEFRALVAATPTLQSTSFTPLAFQPPAAPRGIDMAAKSVVSIFAGTGHGSGVLISSDGYVLTNHHVAGDRGVVRIRWADGTESTGEVLRGDARRDVALVKTTPKASAIPPRIAPVSLGETVFAVGTPLDKQLAGTLTRGVVSASRDLEGQSWIQSDVAVTQGNSGGPLLDEKGQVVGLTAWGIQPNGASANLNFFIPIQDALRVLALKPSS